MFFTAACTTLSFTVGIPVSRRLETDGSLSSKSPGSIRYLRNHRASGTTAFASQAPTDSRAIWRRDAPVEARRDSDRFAFAIDGRLAERDQGCICIHSM